MGHMIPTRPSPSTGNAKTQIEQQGHYYMQSGPGRTKFQPHQRHVDKHVALREMLHEAWKRQKLFNLADLVEGGHEQVCLQDKAMIDYDYLRSVAQVHYFHKIMPLLINLDAAMHSK